ncbi:MAG: HupE/UreJ family protein [candidate division KSB1 bacterium]|nr:HupE/UreJ family protein [candidate division KSB1 bacterium]
MKLIRWTGLCAAAAVLLGASMVRAHQMYTCYTGITMRGDTLHLELIFDTTDLQRVFGLAGADSQAIAAGAWAQDFVRMIDYMQSRIEVRVDYLPLQMGFIDHAVSRDGQGNVFVHFRFRSPPLKNATALNAKFLFFDDFGERFKNLIKVVHGEQLHQYVTFADLPTIRLQLGDEVDLGRQIVTFIRLGIEHIFIGIDHILFLFGLLVLGGRFWHLVKIVTSFTVAHSLTLILAALGWVNLPVKLVESAIALSIAYVAAENFIAKSIDRRWLLTGFFGLVHGFGFANVLQELGLPSRGLVSSLLAFNLGVELGQVVIVALFLPMLWFINRSAHRTAFVWTTSAIIFLFGITWFLERAFNLPVAII